jgi:hypothetical protein
MKANMSGVKTSGTGNDLKPPSGASLLLVGLKSEGAPETSYVYRPPRTFFSPGLVFG